VQKIVRCTWAGADPLMCAYHDNEWGVPVHQDKLHFELITLEGAQAGLSWATILKKREGYRKSFSDFNPEIIAGYRSAQIKKLLTNPEIVRNRLKIESTVSNAKAFIKVQTEFITFDQYMWRFTDGQTIKNNRKSPAQVPARTPLSDAISKDLTQRGFKFVGTTICYAYMQAAGLVDDHLISCWKNKI
jgi:DNA-3-methyladenine glycosylase I